MTVRSKLSLVILSLLITNAVSPNALAACVNSPEALAGNCCSATELGTSRLDQDSVNIIVCLKTSTSDSTTVWKTMSATYHNCPQGYMWFDGYNTCVDVYCGLSQNLCATR